jgi:hypothetical protein
VLRFLVDQIIVEDDAITIRHIIPTDESSRLLPRHNMHGTLHSLEVKAVSHSEIMGSVPSSMIRNSGWAERGIFPH